MNIMITITHGSASDSDKARAAEAADASLTKSGCSAVDAWRDYSADRDTLAGLAWSDAQGAASYDLTEGWRDPSGADCTISLIQQVAA
jgi:hypothetical protein